MLEIHVRRTPLVDLTLLIDRDSLVAEFFPKKSLKVLCAYETRALNLDDVCKITGNSGAEELEFGAKAQRSGGPVWQVLRFCNNALYEYCTGSSLSFPQHELLFGSYSKSKTKK